jgi:predicted Zn finger-like uncharacterized protein
MLITCTSCEAKYRVADEKVAGKTVRLRCKRCGVVVVVDSRAAPAESSVMFSLAMLTQQATKPAPTSPVEDIAHLSAGDVFAPVLAAPPVTEPEVRRAGGRWIAVGVGVGLALAMPVAVYAMRSRAPSPVPMASTSTSTSTRVDTSIASRESPVASASEHLGSPPAPRTRTNVVAMATASHAVKVVPPPPKCCPGETDMECAMRRSVGKACGS